MDMRIVASDGRVTLGKDLLQHLGVQPGEKLELEKLPDGRAILRRAPTGSIDEFIGLLAEK